MIGNMFVCHHPKDSLLPTVFAFKGFRLQFGEPCPANSDFNLWGRCVCVNEAYYNEGNFQNNFRSFQN